MDVHGPNGKETTGWSATPIILASVLAVVLFVSIVGYLNLRKRVKAMAADLDNAMAELGVQQGRAVSLQQELNRRDAFIDRNVIQGPDVYSAAPPIQSREPVPEEAQADPFAVGSDEESSEDESSEDESSEDESNDSGSDDDESVKSSLESSLDMAGELPQSPTAMSAVQVRPNEIKKIAVLPRGCAWLSQEFDLGTTITQDCQLPKDDLWHEVKMEESPEDQSSWTLPQQDDSQAQAGCYWGEDAVQSPQGEVPSLAEGEGPAEVETTTTEVDRAKSCGQDVGAVPAPIVSSGSGSPPSGPDAPESSMSPPVVQACHYPLLY